MLRCARRERTADDRKSDEGVSHAEPTAYPGALDRAGIRRVVVVLSITEITSWGVLYYAFPVLLTSIVGDTGWSTTQVTAAFSASLIIAAVAGIPVGRRIDRSGPRVLMTAGSVLAVPAVLLIASAPNYMTFLGGWILAGVAMSGVLYAPAFAALTHWGGSQRVAVLTTLTLVAGLASTVFAPLTALISNHLDWRHTYLVLLVVLTIVTVPAHWLGLNHPWTPHARSARDGEPVARPVTSSRAFILLAISFSAVAFTIFAGVINLVPLLEERGFSSGDAALALGLGGVGQVAGRLGYAKFAAHTGTTSRAIIVIGSVAGTTGLLALLAGPLLLIIAVSMMAGVGRGIFTLIQATAVSDRWGTAGYGRLNGVLSAPIMVATAIAPVAGAALAEATSGQPAAFAILALVAVIAAAIATGTNPHTQEYP